ncbi:unnamed protein product [Rhizophagus irregularis]|nr:unnamed protein product [Rhizophagus irregularis]
MFNLANCYYNGEGTEKNLEKAFHWYQKAAENGNEDSMFHLANYYKYGEGTKKNLEKAFYWYQKAAENGNKFAMFHLAKCYENGEETEKNLEKAFYWCHKAAENGNENAMNRLALYYAIGEETLKNLEKTFHWYQKAAENGNEDAMFYLANCYRYGEGTEKNFEKAFYWYQKATENDIKGAMYNLSLLYYNGEGTEKNLEKAFYWCQKAAENGNEDAMFNLANCYKYGEGTEKNLEKAFHLYQKAVEYGNEDAMFNLANCYKYGEGTEKNLEKTFYWYQKAAESSIEGEIVKCYENGEGTEKNLEKAFHWYQKAAKNNKLAMFYLAICYENGEGTEKNLEKAFYWYQKAVKNGNENAMNNLAICYENGMGTKKDLEKAFDLYQKAAENGDKEAQFNLGVCYEVGNALKYEKVKFISYNELKNEVSLDAGGFGKISKAIWTKTNSYVICKKLVNTTYIKNDLLDAFIHELKMHLHLNYSDRIIRYFGISLDPKTNEYLLIMQYANGGDLQNHLKNDFKNLTWNDKKKLAFQIADGLNYLHNENILHRDLHSKNIVIHENNAKITDFGISKNQNNQTSTVYVGNFGVVSYMEPKCFIEPKFPYAKPSDIYSFGVLMWEISSGYPPFKDNVNKVVLAISIGNGAREVTIPGTPKEYEKLYKNCWNQEPEQRSTINEILDEFERMGFGNNVTNKLAEDNDNLTSGSQASAESLEHVHSSSNLHINWNKLDNTQSN